jgi:hypothetical protein
VLVVLNFKCKSQLTKPVVLTEVTNGGAKFYEREDCKCANVWVGLRASNKGVPEMCDFSLYSVRSRPAQVGDKLITHDFGTGTRGFAAVDDFNLAVCLMPGTELAFSSEVAIPAVWPSRVGDEDNQSPDGNLSASQQRKASRTSRCARIPGWADRVADDPV